MTPARLPKTGKDERRLVAVMLDYAFGKGIGWALPSKEVRVTRSRRSGRVKLIHADDRLFATVKPNGSIALSIDGAEVLAKNHIFRANCVQVVGDAAQFVKGGKSVFCKFVASAGRNVFPGSEVCIVDGRGRVIGVGMAVMNGVHMRQFKSGVAVKVRAGLVVEDGQ